MSQEIKEMLNNADSNTKFKMVDEDGTEKEMNIAGFIEQLLNDNKHLLDCINNLKNENEDIKKLNNANYLSFIDCNKKRLKAIEIINYYAIEDEDYSKIYNDEEKELLKVLGGDE